MGTIRNDNGDLPWYVRLLEQHGISTVLVFVALWFAYIHGGNIVDTYIQNQKVERQEMSAFLQAQIAATKRLAESAQVRRDFEMQVNDVHLTQLEALQAIQKELNQANKIMAPVPALRAEELEILKEIRDKS